ncbi:MAG: endonuclease/exonuclease/phosphatase family protein [Nocardioides sp.]
MTSSTATRSGIRRAAALLAGLTMIATGYSTTYGDDAAEAAPPVAARLAESAPSHVPGHAPADPPAPTGLTINDDFTDRVTDVIHLLATHRPLVAGVQEGKASDYHRLARRGLARRYDVRQDVRHDGAAGVAVLWNRVLAQPIGDDSDRPDRLGAGWLELTPAGDGLLSRGVVWQDLKVRTGPSEVRVRLASTHRPPQRNRHLWPTFDRRLAAFCAASPVPVLVFMDANEDGGPANLVRRTGLTWRGVGIDGVLSDLPDGTAPVALERRRSDHHAVSIALELR